MMLGHEAVRAEWNAARAGTRMPHGWLLAGKRGLGKMSFALSVAGELVGAEQGRTHADILVLTHLPRDEKDAQAQAEGKEVALKRNIGIAQIREMQRRLTTRPTLGERRVIIIDPVDDLERAAANALLKSLEEPPPGNYFFLISHRPDRLLPTIRSRCRTLRFAAVDDDSIRALLVRDAPDAPPEAIAGALAVAGGSPGAALDFLAMGLGRTGEILRRIVQEGDTDFSLREQLAAAAGQRPDREKIQALIQIAQAELARNLAQSSGESMRARIDSFQELERLAAEAPTYNYDNGLLVAEIGGLLARSAAASERAHE